LNWIAAFFLQLSAIIAFVPRRLAALWPWRKPQSFRPLRVEDFPDKLQRATIYLAGEGDNLWAASMICPCGCGEVIELNLLRQARPCWDAQEHADGTISLVPSVWRQKGCQSHFFVRHGRIDWC
jgi:hypothetical protein